MTDCPSHLFLLALSDEHDDASVSLAAGATHPLNKSYRTLMGVKTHYQIHVTDVEAFLTDTR